MAVIFRRIVPLFVFALTGCAKTVYVRVPAVCPQDPYCLGSPSAPDAAERRAAFERRLAASTVEVRASRYRTNAGYRTVTSLGTRIGPHGYVLAALHPLHGAERLTVISPSQDGEPREVPVNPLVIDVERDAALLVPPRGDGLAPALPVRIEPTIAGDQVCVLGTSSLRCGRVTATDVGPGASRDFADTDVPSSDGDLGAGVVNVCGELVGVVIGTERGNVRIVPLKAALAALRVTEADLR